MVFYGPGFCTGKPGLFSRLAPRGSRASPSDSVTLCKRPAGSPVQKTGTLYYFVEIRTWILHGLCTGFAPALPRILFSSGPASDTSVPVSDMDIEVHYIRVTGVIRRLLRGAELGHHRMCKSFRIFVALIGSSTGRVPLLSSPLIIGRLCPYDGRADNTGTQYIRFGSTCQGSRNDPGFPGLAGFTVHAW